MYTLLEAIQAAALNAVLNPDSEYYLRRVRRWYSSTFATPLHEVDNIPDEIVLQAYFEDRYESMQPHALMEQKQLLTETVEEREARLAKIAEEKRSAEAFRDKIRAQSVAAQSKAEPETKPILPPTAPNVKPEPKDSATTIALTRELAELGEDITSGKDVSISFQDDNLDALGSADDAP